MSKKPDEDYDPLSYGEIRLGPVQGDGRSPRGEVDEILFDDAPPASASTDFGDASVAFTDSDSPSWELMEGDVGDYMPKPAGEGGVPPEEVYSGSPLMTAPDASAPPAESRTATPPQPPAKPTPPVGLPGLTPGNQPQRPPQAVPSPARDRTPAPRTSATRSAATRSSAPRRTSKVRPVVTPRPLPALAGRRNSGLPVAGGIAIAGLVTGAWFHWGQQNPVLGAVCVALGLVGGLFAFVLLRR